MLDLRTGRRRSLNPLPAQGWIVSVAFTPTGEHVVGASFEGAVRVWSRASGSITQTFATQPSGRNLAVAPDGRTVLSGGANGSVAAWDLSGGQQMGRAFRWAPPGQGCLTTPCFVVNRQSTLMAANRTGGAVTLIDLRTRKVVDTLPARNGPITEALAFFPDGRRLAIGGIAGRLTLWDVRARKVLRTIRYPDPVWWIAVSPDGKRLAVQTQPNDAPESRVEIRDVASNRVLYTRVVQVGKGRGGVSFSPDGRRLAAAHCCRPGSKVEVWDARSGKPASTLQVGGYATSVAFSPDGRLLGAGTVNGKVVLSNTDDGARAGPPIEAGKDEIGSVSFSPDGRLLAAASVEGTTSVWDLDSRQRLGEYFPLVQGVTPAAEFAPDADLVVAYQADAVKWPMDLRKWQCFACRAAGRDLTPEEWSDTLPDRDYQSVCPP